MKITISTPNPAFQATEQMAKMLGISRRELFTQAMFEYISAYKYQHITEQLNALYEENNATLDQTLSVLQKKSLSKELW